MKKQQDEKLAKRWVDAFFPLPCLGLSVAGEGRASDGFDIDGGGGFFGLFYRKKNENIQSSYQFCHINHMHNWKICKFFPGIPLYSMVHRISHKCMHSRTHTAFSKENR